MILTQLIRVGVIYRGTATSTEKGLMPRFAPARSILLVVERLTMLKKDETIVKITRLYQ